MEAAEHLPPAVLPANIRADIGSSSVDIFPWEVVSLKANNLNWDPRPSPFSFETYAPQFDHANAQFVLNNGPQFIVWHNFGFNGVQGIDGRSILWDEPATLRAILARYTYVDSNQHFILLKRLPKAVAQPAAVPPPIQLASTNLINVAANNNLVCANINVKNNICEM